MKLFDYIKNINSKSGLIDEAKFNLSSKNYNQVLIEKMYTFTRFILKIDELNNLQCGGLELNNYLHYYWFYTNIPKNNDFIKVPKHDKKKMEILNKYKMEIKHYNLLVFVEGKKAIDKAIKDDHVKKLRK